MAKAFTRVDFSGLRIGSEDKLSDPKDGILETLLKEVEECEDEGVEEMAKAAGIASVAAATAVVFEVTTDLKNAIFFLL